MDLLIGLSTAFWIGILTAISPCPLATNIAAISFISKKIENKKIVLMTGALYTLGRMFTYIALSYIVIKSILEIPSLSFFLQTHMLKILGPLLIVIGMFLLELITMPLPSMGGGGKFQSFFQNAGIWGAFPLGMLFALSFCPVSAALFFGSLIPLATKYSSATLFSSMYGIGTGLPVFLFSILIAVGVTSVGKIFQKIGKVEYWVRMVTGTLLIGIGIYFTLTYLLNIL
ncbi:MAG: cytochrome C biogenesis protein [Bdellovibrionales bacterium RIFOXYB1_FULL_37_110]|nr:MAG: cytochrome C biogenesis protein [Bdellovibrionales bacterium RIFOXYC1_FULL_37_79]OFZ57317.1 MAG: cytochrome C biogenesis protein [Bdellovibrionales bacterium RIFOXYB1_FULL_37_110]OFZ62213.1 MAG: cytochrome C biogenesis protein [Bdellovibrionales bacterium RIFOXYD1_FULL_36_51]